MPPLVRPVAVIVPCVLGRPHTMLKLSNACSIIYPTATLDGDRPADEQATAVRQELADQAEQLLAASGTPEMAEAAKGLRLTALNVRRLLTRPLFTQPPLQLDPSLPDPELRPAELADLAVDVVGATDYLLRLLAAPPA
jgi:hypothetical protein